MSNKVYSIEKDVLGGSKEILGMYSKADYAINDCNQEVRRFLGSKWGDHVTKSSFDVDLGIEHSVEIYHVDRDNEDRAIIMTRDFVAAFTVQCYDLDPTQI